MLRLAVLRSAQLVDRLQYPEPCSLAREVALAEEFISARRGLNVGSVAELLDQLGGRSPDVEIGNHDRRTSTRLTTAVDQSTSYSARQGSFALTAARSL